MNRRARVTDADVAFSDMSRLWPHQRDAAELTAKHLTSAVDDDEVPRAQVRMACGLGKTAVGGVVSRLVASDGRVLVLVPTVLLLTQTLAEYRRALGEAAVGRVLVVCAPQQVIAGGRAARQDLEQQRVPVTTDPRVIAEFAATTGRVTTLSTYASVGAIVTAHREHGLPAWDLLVADEAHRTAGAAGRPWVRVHDQERLPARRRLYMTATPRLASGSSDGAGRVGMDNVRVFGPVTYRMGFATGIELGLLAPWRLVIATVSDTDVRAATTVDPDEGGFVQLGRAAIPARMLAVQIALLRTAAEFGVRRVLSYHARVATARAFAATLPLAAELLPEGDRPAQIWARDLHGQHTAAQRDIRLQALAEGLDDGMCVLSNARLLSEGVDVPAVDGVLFADPRASTIDIVQAIGRALRRGGDPDKVATIIVPLLTSPEAAADPERLDDSAYRPVWQVVRALRAHDETLAAELDARRHRSTASNWREDTPDVWEPHWLHVRGTQLPDNFHEAVTVHLIEATSSPWEEFFAAAQEYHRQHGHLKVPSKYVHNGVHLGRWLVARRIDHRKGVLSPARVAALNSLGMDWGQSRDAAWQRGLAAARAYHAKHGHLNVPQSERFQGIPLGHWLDQCRVLHRKGRLLADRVQALQALGMDWDPEETAWHRALSAARDYHTQHGELRVPYGYRTADGFDLGGWLSKQRLRRQAGTLTDDRVAHLDALGMNWTAARPPSTQGTIRPLRDSPERQWELGLAAARAYVAQHGHLNVPQRKHFQDFPLGYWLNQRRIHYRNGKLPTDQIHALEALGIDWNPSETDWSHGLAAARAYHAKYGHLDIDHNEYFEDYPLGKWLTSRRIDYRRARLPADRVQALEALGMVWVRATNHNRATQSRLPSRSAPTTPSPHDHIPRENP